MINALITDRVTLSDYISLDRIYNFILIQCYIYMCYKAIDIIRSCRSCARMNSNHLYYLHFEPTIILSDNDGLLILLIQFIRTLQYLMSFKSMN